MLTKEERAAIAERIKSVGYVDEKTFYESIVGKCVPSTTPYSEDLKTIFRVVLDLCDTSNMVELPRDKDGEVTHIDDIVYDENNKRYEVRQLTLDGNKWFVLAFSGGSCGDGYSFPVKFTHKKPVTNKSLASDIKRIANQGQVDRKVYEELFRIAWALESLGDSDD